MDSPSTSDQFDYERVVTRLFQRVRQPFNLGLREYLSAFDLLKGGYDFSEPEDLKLLLQLLWCHSIPQQLQFERIWDEVIQQTPVAPPQNQPQRPPQKLPSSEIPPRPEETTTPIPIQQRQQERSAQPDVKPLGIKPQLSPTDIGDLPELETYWPILPRSMAYAWRYLRRPRPDGPQDVLDIEATVEQVAKTGFFLSPILHRREINHASLLLLIDQDGSMTPFHRFSRDLVATAFSGGDLVRVDAYYFHNLPETDDYTDDDKDPPLKKPVDKVLETHVYKDPRLTQPVDIREMWSICDADTSVLIFSDAGAARGRQRIERLRATTEFIVPLRQRTPLIGWLNPMPKDRWESTTAELIASMVPMEQMDNDGFSNLIGIIRGQQLSSLGG